MKKVLLLLPVFLLIIGAVRAVESPKHEIRAVWLTTVYGLDWPKRPATTEAGRKAQQQELCTILDRLADANFNAVFLQVRLRGTSFTVRLLNRLRKHSQVNTAQCPDTIRWLLR